MGIESRQSPVYGNISVLSQNGTLMFRCGYKKQRWYLNRGLANAVNEHTIQLTFQPNGMGHHKDNYHIQQLMNKCCVCGTTEKLSRHHIVPYCYRRNLCQVSQKYRREHHDILPLCLDCHKLYEYQFAYDLKKQIAKENTAPLGGLGLLDVRKKQGIYKMAHALVNLSEQIPEERKKEIFNKLAVFLGHKPTQQECDQLANMKIDPRGTGYRTHGEVVIKATKNKSEFVQRWRQHFINTMKPQHMPPYWNVTRPTPELD